METMAMALLVLLMIAGLATVTAMAAREIRARQAEAELAEVEPEPPVVVGPSAPIVVGPGDGPGPAAAEPPAARIVHRPSPVPASGLVVGPPPEIFVRPAPGFVVEAGVRGAWDELGWVRSTVKRRNVYRGLYRARKDGRPWAFAGRIVEERRSFTPYIADPPPEIKRHPKGPCFHLVGAPWFRVDWHRPARCVDDAILYVEKVLDEALNGKR